jgi:hypothetical protein
MVDGKHFGRITWSLAEVLGAEVLGEVTLKVYAPEIKTFLRKGRDFLKLLVSSVDSKHPAAWVGALDLCNHVNHIVVVHIQSWVKTYHIAHGQLVVLGVLDLRQ